MQTTSVKVAWSKFNALVSAQTTLVREGHTVPAQDIEPMLEEAKNEFSAELFKLVEEVDQFEEDLVELAKPMEAKTDGEDPVGEEPADSNDSDETEDGEG